MPPVAESSVGHVRTSQAWPGIAGPEEFVARPGSSKTGLEGGLPRRSGPGCTVIGEPSALRSWIVGVPRTWQGAVDRSEKTKPPVSWPSVKPSPPVNLAAKSADVQSAVPAGTGRGVGAASGAGFRADQGTTSATLWVLELGATAPPHPARTVVSTTPTKVTARGQGRKSRLPPWNRSHGLVTCSPTLTRSRSLPVRPCGMSGNRGQPICHQGAFFEIRVWAGGAPPTARATCLMDALADHGPSSSVGSLRIPITPSGDATRPAHS